MSKNISKKLNNIYTLDVGDPENYPVENITIFLLKFFGEDEEICIQEIKAYIDDLKKRKSNFVDGLDLNASKMRARKSLLTPLQKVVEIMQEQEVDTLILD
jgi:hypothetical protein